MQGKKHPCTHLLTMNEYILKGANLNAVTFAYSEEGLLCYLDARDITEQQRQWLYDNLKLQEADLPNFQILLLALRKKGKDITLTKVEKDLSFSAFWESYANKKGKKETVKRKWDGMDQADKQAAFDYIKKYNYELQINSWQSKKYPLSYLNAREWEH